MTFAPHGVLFNRKEKNNDYFRTSSVYDGLFGYRYLRPNGRDELGDLMIMMISCICGGIGEIAAIVGVTSIVSAIITKCYNQYQCRKANCRHNCGKTTERFDYVNNTDGPHFDDRR